MTATFETLMQLDAELVRAGHLPLTPWWQEQLRRFYSHPTARTFVARVGRGGVKSNTSAKVALNETLFGDWKIPPGERHFWAFVSKSKDEAAQRLHLLESFLRALHVGFDSAGDEIALRDGPRGFRVFACQVGSGSGFRCYGDTEDELAKWTALPGAASPAVEVIADLNAMKVTHPGARRLLFSSPQSTVDEHARRFEIGDTPDQIVAWAPTWVANPGVTEQQTHEQEPDPRIQRREYGALTEDAVSCILTAEVVDRAIRHPRTYSTSFPWAMFADPSSGKKDEWSHGTASWCRAATPCAELDNCAGGPAGVARWERVYCGNDPGFLDAQGRATGPEWQDKCFLQPTTGGPWVPFTPPPPDKPFLMFHEIGGYEASYFLQRDPGDIVAELAQIARRDGITRVFADQRESAALGALFRQQSLEYIENPWTATSKPLAIERLRRLFQTGNIAIPNDEKLRRELLQFEQRYTPSGAITFGARGSGHDDRCAVLISACLADVLGQLEGSALQLTNFRTEVPGG